MNLGFYLAGLVVVIVAVKLLVWKTPTPDISGPVVRVFDGDTIEILGRDKRPVKVRLYGIDAPEKGQPFGESAKQLASELAYQREARVFVRDFDRTYGRVVGEVKIGRTNLNKKMVDEGQAWAYQHFTDQYVKNEGKAKSRKKGLWRDSQPMAPWEWRQKMRYTTSYY